MEKLPLSVITAPVRDQPYLPSVRAKKLPGVLYQFAHEVAKENGVSNKTHYQHHGAWFARNGYVCLSIDTIQNRNEDIITVLTRGKCFGGCLVVTHLLVSRLKRPCNRLSTDSRPEADGSRIGVTGRLVAEPILGGSSC